MPELPDLLYINRYLNEHLAGRSITACEIRKPVVLRLGIDQKPETALVGKKIVSSEIRGPFLRILLAPEYEMVINLMLAGKLQHQKPGAKVAGYQCLSLSLDDGSVLHVCDQKLMAKVYIVPKGETSAVPRYDDQGVDILSPLFTFQQFEGLASRNRRKQVRVFLTDQRSLSAIGNAYADEILFEARIHPKTFLRNLDKEKLGNLYQAIRDALAWGAEEVRSAGEPIHVKVRGHMKVRNRKGDPCPRCGDTIRREGVRGYDVFFCPTCQPPTRDLFIDWRNVSS